MAILLNFYILIGLFLIVTAIAMILFPPKFGSFFYGVRTKVTMRNRIIWTNGQKLFSYAILTMGLILPILGIIKIEKIIDPFPMILLFIFLWKLAEYFINRFLVSKYPNA